MRTRDRYQGTWLVCAAALAAALGAACAETPVVVDGTGGGGGDDGCASQTELCNGADDDCDGTVDEGCPCEPGDTQACYGGAFATKDVGPCKAGAQACGASGIWGGCEGQVLPAFEACNGVDDDCSGAPDQLDPGGGGACDTGLVGVCQAGIEHCAAGAIGCVQTKQPGAEICNGLDDDCDGETDEDDPGGNLACVTGSPGICAQGVTHCTFGVISCDDAVSPTSEACNDLDDDCNGLVDDGDPGGGAACATGLLGACAAGGMHCTGGALACLPDAPATTETCSGLDEDCNGVVDDAPGLGAACACGGINVCAGGAVTCETESGPATSGWSVGLPAAAIVTDIVVDDAGDATVIGVFDAPVDFGDGTLTPAGRDVFIARFQGDGAFVWSRMWSNDPAMAYTLTAASVVVDANGVARVAVNEPSAACGDAAYLVSFDPNGTLLGQAAYPVPAGAAGVTALGLGVAPSGNVVRTAVAYTTDALCAKTGARLVLDAVASDLTMVSSLVVSGSGVVTASKRVAVDAAGAAFVAGTFDGTLDLGGASLVSAGSDDAMLVKLDPLGAIAWARSFGDGAAQRATAVALDASGRPYLAATFAGAIDAGGGAKASLGGTDVLMAAFDTKGALRWDQQLGGSGDDSASDLFIDLGGYIIAMGGFSGTVDFTGAIETSVGATDLFLFSLDGAGGYDTHRTYPGATGAFAGVDCSSQPIIAGHGGPVDFGDGPIQDGFVAKISYASGGGG